MYLKPIVYLSGGLGKEWQDYVIKKCSDEFVFFNPNDHKLHVGEEYTTWDLYHIRKCDIVFAFLEKDNPSGIGLALEVGYASALGKTIIFVNEQKEINNDVSTKFKIVTETASITFNDLSDGIRMLRTFKDSNSRE